MSPEYESSWEHLSNEERRKKIAAHISAMRIGHRILEESHAQQEAIQDFEARPYQLDAFNALWTARRDGAERMQEQKETRQPQERQARCQGNQILT